jgi:ParB-like chromosome segregation protein Spo0J
MEQSERRARIRANLGIEAISHGQVHTSQIAIPESEKKDIPLERQQILEDSLTEHKSNLVPLIVRRTEDYSEEEEYEVVYGADWCLVAKELDIEKLWVWVFDMTDEQAAAAKVEMEQLAGSKEEFGSESLLDQKLKPITVKLNQVSSILQSNAEKSVNDDKLEAIESRLEQLVSTVEKLTAQVKELLPSPKLNLMQAQDEEIDSALQEGGASTTQRKAALEAIQYWKASDQGLSWQNLEKSTKQGKDKINNFAKGTYQKLKAVADIHS